MIGGEIGPGAVGKGVGEAIKAALPGSEDRAQFREVAKDSHAIEVAAYSRADRMAITQMAVTKLYAPLAKWVGYKSTYFEQGQFAEDMATKLAGVPQERLVSPQPIVAAQAIEGLGFSLDETDLKEMYLNLLATASDTQTASHAHPSFAQIIKELSAPEAGILLTVLRFPHGQAMVEVRLNTAEPPSWQTLDRHVVPLQDSVTGEQREIENWAMYVDNWVRLGLVSVDYSAKRIGDAAYAWTEQRPEVIRARVKYEGAENLSVGCHEGLLVTTTLGMQFAAAVGPSTDETS